MKAKKRNAAYIPSGSATQSLEKTKDGFRLYEQISTSTTFRTMWMIRTRMTAY